MDRDEAVEIVKLSLRLNPDEWEFADYTAENKRLGAKIWLTNRYYGTELIINGAHFGGIPTFLFYRRKWRRQLVRAADAARSRKCICNGNGRDRKAPKR